MPGLHAPPGREPRRHAAPQRARDEGNPAPPGITFASVRELNLRLYRRRAGSRSAWCRASASAETRAYLASDRTEV